METQQQDNSAGAIWINEGKGKKAGEKILSVALDGEMYTGFKNTKKGDNDKAPDYNICRKLDDGKFETVGAGWAGTTKQDRQKLSIKMDVPGQETTYFTAVTRDGEPTGKRADMTILRNADKSEQLTMDANAAVVEEPAAKAKPKSL